MPPLRIIFMGTAELACASLEALAGQPDFAVVAVVTQPDRPKGRELKLQPSPVKELALRRQLPVLQPERARHENFIAQLRELTPDLIVVAAYGQILPQAILDLPRFGCLNVHTSLLPKYRGAAPIQWAILSGETETGVTIMKMDAGLDTGDILTQQATPIADAENSQTLHDRLARIGAELLIPTIRDFTGGKITPRAQPTEGVSIARKITREDGRLDWAQPARALWNRIRALTPWPGAFTHLPDARQKFALTKSPSPQPSPPVGAREGKGQPESTGVLSGNSHQTLLKIWQAETADAAGLPGVILQADKNGILVGCGEQSLRITQLQREGGRRLTAQEFLAGHPLNVGEKVI